MESPDPQQVQYAAASGRSDTIGAATAAAPTGSAVPQDAPPASPRRRFILNRRVAIIGGVIVLGLGLAGGALAVLGTINSPGQQLAAALAKLGTVESLQYEAQATIQIDQGGATDSKQSPDPEPADDTPRSIPRSTPRATPKPRTPLHTTLVPSAHAETAEPTDGNQLLDVVFSAKGGIDLKDHANPKTSQTFNLTAQEAKVPVLNYGLEVRTIGTEGFARLTEGSGFDLIDLSPIKNVWIKASSEEIDQQVSSQTGQEALDKLDENQIKELTEAAKQSKLVTVKKLSDEDIDGISARHYRYEIQKDKLKDFIPRANQIIYQKPLSQEEVDEISDSFNEFDFLPGEAWVGKQDKLPHKMTLGISPKDKSLFGDVLLSVSAKDFNQPVAVEAPEGAKTLEEVERLLNADNPNRSKPRDETTNLYMLSFQSSLNSYAKAGKPLPKTTKATRVTKDGELYRTLGPQPYLLSTGVPSVELETTAYYYASDGVRYGVCYDSPFIRGTRWQIGPAGDPRAVAGNATDCPLLK